MAMTVLVTRNASDRTRGFLASSMLELAAGVYVAANMTPAVRDKVWAVVTQWIDSEASAIILWQDKTAIGLISSKVIGEPPIAISDIDGLLVSRR
jgi:CRISPR-associated protein Cas2